MDKIVSANQNSARKLGPLLRVVGTVAVAATITTGCATKAPVDDTTRSFPNPAEIAPYYPDMVPPIGSGQPQMNPIGR
jgi:hypothetical protein